MSILCAIISVYMVILVARAVLSWLPPPRTGGLYASVSRLLNDLTEPVLAPVRRVIPPIGMIDISFIVLIFGLSILLRVIC